MESKIIVMLTHNDQTVEDALEVFESCKNLPVDFWGFKDVGLPAPKMKELHAAMKAAGKKAFLEVVTYTTEACMAGAKLAVEFGFDYLMGTIFYPEVWTFLKNKPIQYLPFVGEVSGSPSILKGSIESMLAQAAGFVEMGIPGVDLLAYRFVEGDPELLAKDFVAAAGLKVVVAGSISSPERIAVINSINPWAFTMGSALFNKNFVRDASFRDNLSRVVEIINSL
jgi:hypothetical protein